ncbi:sensor histidine kinase [Streptosporangium subroseum]|uniref:sensor histidine kinase n=1 Tax=Streptosporangium subroseum TaxID=106412 RepID=UPI000B786A59|nr:ATP-binding protein [Streptosporangium subroseum]
MTAGRSTASPKIAVVLYRVADELLRNAFRHAQARMVRVGVVARDTGHATVVELTVTDDGVGFDPRRSRRPGHVGLQLVERVIDDNGGRLVMIGEPGTGTVATMSMPCVTFPGRVRT